MIKITGFKSLLEFVQYFSNENIAREYLEAHRWEGIPTCPYCGCQNWSKMTNRYKCKDKTCKRSYSVTVGTFMENTNIKLDKWLMAMYVISAHKTGISSVQLAKDIGVTQKSAWFLLHRIREMFKERNPLLTGIVEIDEVFIGAKIRRHRNKNLKPGRGSVNKIPVLGLLQRDGNIIYRVIPDVKEETLKPIIRELVDPTAIINTDGHLSYVGLDKEFAAHEAVQHGAGEYVRGMFHTNGVEGAFGMLRRGIRGIYIKMTLKHLHRYCTEFSYRYNTRKMNDYNRFEGLLQKITGRLRYKDLIGR